MRIPLEQVFRVHVENDGLHLDALRTVAMSREAEERLHFGIDRIRSVERLCSCPLEVYEDETGILHVEGFAAVEAR